MEPSFFCIGFQKCGTTTLYDILKQNEHIYLTEDVKEPMFYRASFFRRLYGKQWYHNRYFRYAAEHPDCVTGEVNAGLGFLHCAKWLGKDFSPDTKFIFMMRDPAARCYSAYKYFLALGFLPRRVVRNDKKKGHAEAFDEYVHEILRAPEKRRRIMVRRLKYLCFSQGNYAYCIKEYLKYFPIENMKFVFFEDFIADEEGVTKDILDFLNIPEDPDMTFNLKSNEGNFCTVSPVHSKILYCMQGIRYFFLEFLSLNRRFPRFYSQFSRFYDWTFQKCTRPETDHSKMQDRTRRLLNHYYKKQIQQVEELTGRNVPENWGC